MAWYDNLLFVSGLFCEVNTRTNSSNSTGMNIAWPRNQKHSTVKWFMRWGGHNLWCACASEEERWLNDALALRLVLLLVVDGVWFRVWSRLFRVLWCLQNLHSPSVSISGSMSHSHSFALNH